MILLDYPKVMRMECLMVIELEYLSVSLRDLLVKLKVHLMGMMMEYQ